MSKVYLRIFFHFSPTLRFFKISLFLCVDQNYGRFKIWPNLFSVKDFFDQKIFFYSKMHLNDSFDKKSVFAQKWFFRPKNVFFAQKWFFRPKNMFLLKNDFFGQKRSFSPKKYCFGQNLLPKVDFLIEYRLNILERIRVRIRVRFLKDDWGARRL